MSDDPSPASPVPPPSPGGPLGKTQAVPLKKETVRITLRAKPGEAPPSPEGAAPIAPPTAPLRPAAPPPAAMARPPAPAPPSAPLGSRTIPLTSAPAPRGPTTPGRPPTQALAGGSPATQPMPKPTVRLQPQAAPGAAATGAISSAPLKTAVLDEEDEEANDKGLGLIAGIVLGLAAILLLITALSSDDFKLGVSLDQANAGWKIPRKAVKPTEEDFAKPPTVVGDKLSWKTSLDLPNQKKINEFTGAK